MHQRRVLVTGGAGYIGSHICKYLRQSGIPYLAYDNFSTGHRHMLAGNDWMEGDITDARELQSAFSMFMPNTVIHLAALATMGECTARPDECWRINVEGTRQVLDSMRIHGVRDMIFASSCAVYAMPRRFTPLHETMPLQADSPYGRSKLAAEALLAQYAPDIRSIALRLFNVAGADPQGEIGEAHAPETHLLPLALDALAGKGPLNIFGTDYPTEDGTALRDYIHIWDIAEAVPLALQYLDGYNGPVLALNMGSGQGTTVYQLLAAIARITGKDVPRQVQPRRAGDTPWLLADMSHVSALLGWSPQRSDMDTIIRSAMRWHENCH